MKSRGWKQGCNGYQGRLQKIMIVRKDCNAIPSSSDCLFCLFFPLSSFKSSFVDNWFSVYVDDITSGLCFVVEIMGADVASSEGKNKEINNFKTLCYKDFDMDLCHT